MINKNEYLLATKDYLDKERQCIAKINTVVLTHGEVPHNHVDALNRSRSESVRYLEAYVTANGWPVDLANEELHMNTWLLAQNALGIPDVATLFLHEMEKALSKGLPGWQYAFFFDHRAHRRGYAQRYGTVLQTNQAGVIVAYTLEDAANVDAFRREMGLPPLAEAIHAASQKFHSNRS